MMSPKKGTREKILKVAEKIFAKKGFDGARVDEIALKAGVNKALIYYYFESKEKILEEIMSYFLEDSMKRKDGIIENLKRLTKEEFTEAAAQKVFSLFKGKEDILRIVITEELKSAKKHWPLFQLLDKGIEESFNMAEDKGMDLKDREKLILAAFYFGFIPVAFFSLLEDEWTAYYKTDREEDKKKFMEILKKTYIRLLVEEFLV